MGGANDLYDPRPHRALADKEVADWTGNLAPEQIDVLIYIYNLREVLVGDLPEEEKKEVMPNATAILERALPLTVSLRALGREQFVEVLKAHHQDRPSVEELRPIEKRRTVVEGDGSGV